MMLQTVEHFCLGSSLISLRHWTLTGKGLRLLAQAKDPTRAVAAALASIYDGGFALRCARLGRCVLSDSGGLGD